MNRATNTVRSAIRGVCFLVALIALVLVSRALAKSSPSGGGGCTGCVNVTSTVFDTDSSGLSILFRSDDNNGGNYASYVTGTAPGNSNIESFIDGSGVWYLNLYPQKTGTRTVYITPNDPVVSGEPMAPPAQQYWQNVEITSKCMDGSGNTVPFANLVNGSSNCTFGIDFGYNGVVYKLLIGRVMNAGDPSPGTASVACNAVSSSNQCVNWTITAGAETSPLVANLYSNTAGWVFIGQYYNSVRVNVKE